ncbi:head-tail joining protein [Bacillus phage vB_Bacillus_1020A]|jgi:HK97 gp10 family phage protein|uniref:HK97-gp10 family putative phage morphogenesis protein n=1 Tax=Robertmurraya sp. DFI.2.37 TaxID=3031819 RepID=UPI00124900C7|nr:HK97-gp10 family putative phage morphogenesis protein [Robertmurraya sp. DFI.2.37]MDF1510822.1 HK97 gp10 family phage protein [Robertmurraya sp. DFI.2.37]QIW89303.1 head-tail joining protein [Bacillus phage vB_Bacillus_1020A]
MSIRLEGMEHLMSQLNQIGVQLNTEAKNKALMAGVDLMYQKVVENVPKRTRNLEKNIQKSDKVQHDEVSVWVDGQGKGFYGYFLEIGRKAGVATRGKNKGYRYPAMAARPFMGPAYENNIGNVTDKMGEVIRRELGL